jgi:methanogenic corrinoid protein MtbC1
MVGPKYFQATDGTAKQSNSERGAMEVLEDICSDRHYVNGGSSAPQDEQEFKERVEHVIEGEIIPRLMLLHRSEPTKTSDRVQDHPPAISDHLVEFTELVLGQEIEVIGTYLEKLMEKGASLDALLLQLMAPAARRLGDMWDDDLIDFVDVTIGVSRLQQLIHRLTFALEKANEGSSKRVLLLPTPSEQHTFGLLMVSDFFRRNGWDVIGTPSLSIDEISDIVADQWFALIGFSLSCERLIDTLNSTIQTARRVSKNRSVKFVVGGRIFLDVPDLRQQVHADLVVTDAQEAVVLAEQALGGAARKIS